MKCNKNQENKTFWLDEENEQEIKENTKNHKKVLVTKDSCDENTFLDALSKNSKSNQLKKLKNRKQNSNMLNTYF